MKPMVWLVLATLAFGAHAAEEDSTPCDNVETDQQNYDCALFNRTTAERELKASFHERLEGVKEQFGRDSTKIAKATALLNDAQAKWELSREADCKVETFDVKPGKPLETALNNCLAQRSDDRSAYLQDLGPQDQIPEQE